MYIVSDWNWTTMISFLKSACLYLYYSAPSSPSLALLYMILGSGPPLKVMSVAAVLFQVSNDPIAVMTVTPPINQTSLRKCVCVHGSLCVFMWVCVLISRLH